MNLQEAIKKVKAYKAYIADLPANTPRAYTFTKEELFKLLNQKPGGLDGIRIYFGADIINGKMVPVQIMVGCERGSNGELNDYNIPSAETVESRDTAPDGDGNGDDDGAPDPDPINGGLPCPTVCGDPNALN